MSNKTWKSALLSSSLPLEYEVAKLLATKEFVIDPDYTYARDAETGVQKDFSVDIHAVKYLCHDEDADEADSALHLLVECKYRHPATTWVFLPDVNSVVSHIEPGCALRCHDEFSPYIFSRRPFVELTETMNCCYKGMEVHEKDVRDNELRHGIEQLRYAYPRLLEEVSLFNMLSQEDDNSPFCICPILVTTADLVVLKEGFDISSVESASELCNLGTSVPYLITYSGCAPAFKKHCAQATGKLFDCLSEPKVQTIDDLRKHATTSTLQLAKPSFIAYDLQFGMDHTMKAFFTQFFVCNRDYFGGLVDTLCKCVSESAMSATDLRIQRKTPKAKRKTP